MPNVFQLSFYRHARALPDSEPVRLLHRLAREIYREVGGEAIERHVGFYKAIVARWQEGSASPEQRPVGEREAMRAMGACERGYARAAQLRETAWMQARAEVFQQTGERIELPKAPEESGPVLPASTRRSRRAPADLAGPSTPGEAIEILRGLQLQAQALGLGDEERAEPAARATDLGERLTGKQIKAALRRLASARVDKDVRESLKAAAKSGKLSRQEFVGRGRW